MLRMIGQRLMTTIPSVIGVIVVTFLLTRVLPGDTAAYFAGPRRLAAGDHRDPQQARARPAAAGAVRLLCERAGEGRSRPVADHWPAGDERPRRKASRFRRTDLGGAAAGHGGSAAAGRACRREAGLLDRPSLPRRRDGGRLAAGFLHRAAAGSMSSISFSAGRRRRWDGSMSSRRSRRASPGCFWSTPC